jgi:hypothetical protein
MKKPSPLSIAPLILACCGSLCVGADISGTIAYSGSRTGQVHITAAQTLPGNKVLQLDGDGDSVQIAGLTSLAGSELTIQYWFRGSTYQSAVRQQGSGWVIAGWNGQHILQNDGSLTGVSAGEGITDGNWHHVMFTWKQGTTDGFASYLDGQLVQKRNSANAPIPDYNAIVSLGSFNGTGEFTAGMMDAVAIWNRFMSPAEVAATWNKGLQGTEPGLLAYWDFDDGSFNDKSTNHYDGTAGGDATIVEAGIPGFNGGIGSATIAGPGNYTIGGLPSGPDYAVKAFQDVNGSGTWDASEPAGAYAGNPFELSGNKTAVDILLKEPPSITLQPVGARRATGGSASFQVSADGTPPLNYRWYRDDTALVNDARITGATSTNLQITSLVAGDAGGYSCLVSNAQGATTSLAANLDVIVNGKIISGTFVYSGSQTGKVHATVAQLRSNKVLNLDGTNYASTTLTDMSGDELSIEYWFKGSVISSAVRQQGGPGYIVTAWGANYHILSNDGGVAQPVKVSDPLTKVVDGNWHHVAMTWKRDSVNGFASYLDGELVEQRASGNTALPNIGSQVFFGSWNGTSEFSKGQLDEIAIWSRALTRAEIRSQARNGLTGTEVGLRGYWNFDDGLGQDLSPNGNHAELRNDAAIVDAAILGLGATYSDTFAGPGPFQIPAIPAGNGYSLLAYLDVNGNGSQEAIEARGTYTGNPFNLSSDLTGISVVLIDPAGILTNPASVSVIEGGTFKVTATPTGTASTYQWFHYTSPLANGGRISGADSATLTITTAQLADAGAYTLVVSNVLGQASSLPAGVVVQPAVLTNQLIGYWKFDETSGLMASDSTGLAQPGTLINFSNDDSEWIPGIIGRGLSFGDPTNQSYVIASDYTKPTNTMAVSAWVWAETRPNWASIAKNWGSGQGGQFHFGLNANGGQLSDYTTDSDGNAVSAIDTVPLPLGSWQHVAFVADGAHVVLYRNGVQVAQSAAYNGALITPPMASLAIGAKTDDTGTVVDTATPGYWNGKIDDLGIWSRGLSPDEIQGLYLAGLAGKGITQASAVKRLTIAIVLVGNQITVQYEAGNLEWTDDLTGTWSPVPGSSAPSFTTTATLRKFFRVR